MATPVRDASRQNDERMHDLAEEVRNTARLIDQDLVGGRLLIVAPRNAYTEIYFPYLPIRGAPLERMALSFELASPA